MFFKMKHKSYANVPDFKCTDSKLYKILVLLYVRYPLKFSS